MQVDFITVDVEKGPSCHGSRAKVGERDEGSTLAEEKISATAFCVFELDQSIWPVPRCEKSNF